jgi:hypothetical protein
MAAGNFWGEFGDGRLLGAIRWKVVQLRFNERFGLVAARNHFRPSRQPYYKTRSDIRWNT